MSYDKINMLGVLENCDSYKEFKLLQKYLFRWAKEDGVSEDDIVLYRKSAAMKALKSVYRDALDGYKFPEDKLFGRDPEVCMDEARQIVMEAGWQKYEKKLVDDKFEIMRKNAVNDNLKSFSYYATKEEKLGLKSRFAEKNIVWKKLDNIN